jgi:hypothetical protein
MQMFNQGIGRASNALNTAGNFVGNLGNQIQGTAQNVAQNLQGVVAPPQGPIM